MIKYHTENSYINTNNILMNNIQNGGVVHQNGVKSLCTLNEQQLNGGYDIVNSSQFHTPHALLGNNNSNLMQNNGMFSYANNNQQVNPENGSYGFMPGSNSQLNFLQYSPPIDSISQFQLNNSFQNSYGCGNVSHVLLNSPPPCIQPSNFSTIVPDGRNSIKLPQYIKPETSYEAFQHQISINNQRESQAQSPLYYDNSRISYQDSNLKDNSFNQNDIRLISVPPSPFLLQHAYTPISTVKVNLENVNLWNSFYKYGNEMIITKHGRRIYPYLSVHVTGLDPYKRYRIKAGFTQLSNNRYKFHKNKGWKVGNSNEVSIRQPNFYTHPDGLQQGEYWTNKTISFLRMKVTNNQNNKEYIHLNSMHLYVVSVAVIEVDEHMNESIVVKQDFPETRFVAVTAYQNKKITKLKIQHNHYAKGFKNGQRKVRESSEAAENQEHGNTIIENEIN